MQKLGAALLQLTLLLLLLPQLAHARAQPAIQLPDYSLYKRRCAQQHAARGAPRCCARPNARRAALAGTKRARAARMRPAAAPCNTTPRRAMHRFPTQNRPGPTS